MLAEVAARAPQANDARRPDEALFADLGARGLLRLLVPTSAGGRGIGPTELFDVVELVAAVDGSTAWTVMTCNEEAGIVSAYLDPDHVAAFYGEHPAAVVAGSGVPKGRAWPMGDRWAISGRWDFISGCTAADHLILAALVDEGGQRRLCFALVSVDEATIEDTWHTVGLRGTGSHDVVVDTVLPAERVGIVAPLAMPHPAEPYYRLPAGLRFPFPKVAVASGIARAAIAEFEDLAAGKRPLFHRSELRNRPTAQQAIATAEASRASGVAWVRAELAEIEAVVADGGPIDDERHARLRLACSHSVASSIAAVEVVCAEAGSTANAAGSPLPGLLADVRAVAGHFTVAPHQMMTAGRVLLGLPSDDPNF